MNIEIETFTFDWLKNGEESKIFPPSVSFKNKIVINATRIYEIIPHKVENSPFNIDLVLYCVLYDSFNGKTTIWTNEEGYKKFITEK